MGMTFRAMSAALAATTAFAAFGAFNAAEAGGFAIREQSAQFQGSSFAGSAAGGGLSSMYWNPAALGQADWGLISESHFSGIFGQAENTVEMYGGAPAEAVTSNGQLLQGVPHDSGDIADAALVGSSYYAYRLSDRLVLGMSLNSGFGLTTKPNNFNYLGAELGQTTKLFTMNAAPTLAYKIAPGITIAAGVQVQYARAKLGFAVGAPTSPPGLGNAVYRDADDFAFGGTAGVLFEPMAGTSIGIGYRSQLSHELDGKFKSPTTGFATVGATADLDLPDIVTLSIRQAIAPNMRLLGTVEWSNWSRFKQLDLIEKSSGDSLLAHPMEADWSDGWFFALGGEYDYQPGWTLRAGVAYDISPVDGAEKRFTSIPDADRWWLSAGASVQLTHNMAIDLAYSHVFVENGDFLRETQAGNVVAGYSESQVDIISASLKMKFGGERPLEPLK